ncbi:Cyclic di-GMP-binding protein [compost metagenome]
MTELSSDNLFPGTMSVGFRAAPDTFLWQGDNLPMRIRYRFPEGDWFNATDSRLDVSLNGRYLTSVPMIKQGVLERVKNWFGYQTRQEDALIEIPPYLIYGDNQLGFYFNLALDDRENCDLMLPDSSHSFIDADSVIDLSGTQHFAELPNLSFFVGAGFPFTRMADLSETAVVLPVRPESSEIEAMLGLMGRFGDATGYPATRVKVLLGTDGVAQVADHDLLVVGQIGERLDLQPLLEGSAFRIDQQRLRIQQMPLFERVKAVLGGDWGREFDPADRLLSGYKEFQGFISRRSPLDSERAVVMALGSRSEWLPDVVERLRNASLNAHIRGDIAFFESDEKVISYRVGALFSYGSMPWYMYLRWLFSERPLTLVFLLCLASGLAAAGLYPLLRARALARMQG